MKKVLNKIKVSLTALGLAVVSFFSKVMGQFGQETMYDINGNPTYIEALYGVSYPYDVPSPESGSLISFIIKITQRALVGITFIVGIINLIKIKKTGDKIQREKRIKRTIIIMSILVVALVAAFLVPTLLLK